TADEAGLPATPEFRAAFKAYQDWRSRAVLAQPQSSGRPPTSAAVQWDWSAAGRPPVIGPGEQAQDVPLALPGADERVTFVDHIKGLFRTSDREAMKWAFDLASYRDVSGNAASILQRLASGSMPCDGPWSEEKIAVFQRWVDAGTPESATSAAAE